MKKILLLVSMALLVFSCGGNKETVAKDGEIKKLVVGTNAEYKPFEYKEDGKIVGFDIELMEEIGKEIGVEIEWLNTSFDTLLPSLKAGKIDAIIAGMTATDERRKEADFSEIYFSPHEVYLKNKDNTSITKYEDINGKTVGTQLGTIQEIDVKNIDMETMPDIKPMTNESVPNLIMQLANNKIDVVVLESVVAAAYMEENPNLEIFYTRPVDSGASIAFDKGKNTELVAKVNEALKKIREDGRYEKLLEKYKLNIK